MLNLLEIDAMAPDERDNFDDLTLPAELVDDLQSLYTPRLFVPPAMDERIRAEAQRRLGGLRRTRGGRRVWWLSGAAGLAAAVTLAVVLRLTMQSEKPQAFDAAVAATEPADVDRSGRVDILDALALARRIEAKAAVTAWDINGDGVVDERDVDAIAQQAVALDAPLTAGGRS